MNNSRISINRTGSKIPAIIAAAEELEPPFSAN
jgi:hypothetical protein